MMSHGFNHAVHERGLGERFQRFAGRMVDAGKTFLDGFGGNAALTFSVGGKIRLGRSFGISGRRGYEFGSLGRDTFGGQYVGESGIVSSADITVGNTSRTIGGTNPPRYYTNINASGSVIPVDASNTVSLGLNPVLANVEVNYDLNNLNQAGQQVQHAFSDF